MARPHCAVGFWRRFEERGKTNLCLALVLIGIVASGCSGYSKEQEQEMQRIRDVVSADPTTINLQDKAGNTPLHLAVINNYLPLMDWLKGHGADPNSRGPYGDRPLHTAVISDRNSDGRVIRILLRMGADVNAPNDYGDTPLHRAAYHGLTETARLLLKNKADVSRRAQRGETALLYASRPQGHPETVLALLEGGAEVNGADNFGMTPLHGAAMIGNVDVARVLIDKGRADLNRQNLNGYTPLHVAAIGGKTVFVQFLLENGANRDLRDKRNLTPAEAAVQFPAMLYSKEGKQAVDTSAAVNVLRTYSPASGLRPRTEPK
jgi:ankyrin repeat protein